MTRSFGTNDKRFSIDDAFEEETDEAIRVYGATGDQSHPQNKFKNGDDFITSKVLKGVSAEDTASRDSDSLIHECVEPRESAYCWNHPKVREKWRRVCGAALLALAGIALLAAGAVSARPPTLRAGVFALVGMLCFVPGAYHLVYVCLAARGQRGYDFYHLPLFT